MLNSILFDKYDNSNISELERNIYFWQEINEEKWAMEFAKEYFFRYRIRKIINDIQ